MDEKSNISETTKGGQGQRHMGQFTRVTAKSLRVVYVDPKYGNYLHIPLVLSNHNIPFFDSTNQPVTHAWQSFLFNGKPSISA